jgi:hypothetical protein
MLAVERNIGRLYKAATLDMELIAKLEKRLSDILLATMD